MQYPALNRLLGPVDLHLLDQILKGRYQSGMRLLDAGCGEGRNLPYFIRNGFDVWGVDRNPTALRLLRIQGKAWNPAFDPDKFVEGDLVKLPFPPASFEAVICCAVLHFARDEEHFFRMTDELLRVLKPSGSLFIRMNAAFEEVGSTQATPHADEVLPFLLTRLHIDQLLQRYSLRWLEPPRTEHVAGQGARITLIVEKC